MSEFDEDPKFVDGVIMNHFTRNSGKFISVYSQFLISCKDKSYARFQVGHVYTVRTNGVPGFAKLKSIYHIRETDECFCMFGLYHKAENLGEEKLLWQPGKDEVFCFENDIRIRCKDAILWLDNFDNRNGLTSKLASAIDYPSYKLTSPSKVPKSDNGGTFIDVIESGRVVENTMQHRQLPTVSLVELPKFSERLDVDVNILSHSEYMWHKQPKTAMPFFAQYGSNNNPSRGKKIFFNRYTFHDDNVKDFYLFQMEREKSQSQKEKLLASRASFFQKELKTSKKRKREESSVDRNDVVGNILNLMKEKPPSRKKAHPSKKTKLSSSSRSARKVFFSDKINDGLNDPLSERLRKALAD